MRGALLICKKEFMELSKDRKTMFFTFLLPVILYPLLFGMMSRLSRSDAASRENKPSRIVLVDPGKVLEPILKADAKNFEIVPPPAGDLKQGIQDQKLELAVEVDSQAPEQLAKHRTVVVKAMTDTSDDSSKFALKRLKDALKQQDTKWIQARLEGLGASKELAVPTKVETVEAGKPGLMIGKMLGSFLPYMIMLMMFAGSMQHGIYTTAGEKERGTLLSLLVTSLPRNQIIWGKLLYLFSIGLIVALINLATMGITMARIMGPSVGPQAAGSAAGMGALAAIANPTTLVLTFLLMIPLGLLFANFILMMGIQAKNSVEAGTAIMPGFVVVMITAVFSMAPGIEKMAFLPYVPVVNVSLAVRKMFSQQGNPLEYCIALGMTVALAGLLTWLSTRLLNRESVLFKV